jgi:hypothetical protein
MLKLSLMAPPMSLRGNETAGTIVLVITLALIGAAVLWATRRREPLLIALLVGGGLAGFVEAQLDLLSRIWWASNLPRAYTVFGRPIPLLVVATYSLVIGGGMYLAYRVCAADGARRRIVLFGVAFMVLESVFEMVLMTTHFYKYYGPQPLRVFGFPLYWGAINAVGAVMGGCVVYAGRSRLAGPNALLAVLIPPVSFGLDFAVGWPTWNVMNTNASQLTMSLVSLLTFGLCAAELWLVSVAVTRPKSAAPSMAADHDAIALHAPLTVERASTESLQRAV